MAALTRQAVGLGGFIGAFGNTVSGGDDFGVSEGDTLIFHNGHSADITVTLTAVAATVQPQGGFPVAPGNKAFVVVAGQFLVLPISGQNLAAYVNATTKRVAVTYTGHNAALKAIVIAKG